MRYWEDEFVRNAWRKKCTCCGNAKRFFDYYRKTNGYPYSECKTCWNSRVRRFRARNPDKERARRQRQTAAQPLHKQRCRAATRKAVQNGILKRPRRCPCCNRRGKITAHHITYSDPFAIRWFCVPCHAAYHAALRRLGDCRKCGAKENVNAYNRLCENCEKERMARENATRAIYKRKKRAQNSKLR